MFRLSTIVASRAAMASATRRSLPAFATGARHYAVGKTALSAENVRPCFVNGGFG